MQNKENIKKPYKRRTILIKKDLQFRYVALIFISVAVGFIIVGFEIAWNMSRLFSERPALLAPLMGEIELIIPMFVVKLLIYLIVILIVSIVISHRLAGPLYKFEKSAEMVAGGDLTQRMRLRKDDHLGELQNRFNDMVSNIQNKVNRDRRTAVEVSAELQKMADLSQNEDLKNKLNEQAKKLISISKEFKS
jgi:methyl-accepting chemotaxis protein